MSLFSEYRERFLREVGNDASKKDYCWIAMTYLADHGVSPWDYEGVTFAIEELASLNESELIATISKAMSEI